jgi:predicted ATPase
LASIDRMLDESDCRLLTLVGPGGVGKTRLALEAAARRIDRYQHGVHFVPLVGVPAPDLLAAAVAESLQFQVDSAHSAVPAGDQLVDYLRERATLLVLDNFEHLLDARDLLTELIEQAPRVDLLTTSRERLQVQSEWVLDLEGLELGNGNGHAGESAAVRLFVDRARQVDNGYTLSEQERPHVERLCRLVNGMPLGIELAAAWASTLPCSEIADEIERNLGFLETTMHDVPQRHRSLRAAFDQSWRLLLDDERRVFSQLAVFRGSFARDAAAAVARAGLTELHGLVSKSLVRRAELGRFELHELLRQYAAERLAAEHVELAEARERHARFYLGMVASRTEALVGERMMELATSFAWSSTTCGPPPDGPSRNGVTTTPERSSRPSSASSGRTAGTRDRRRSRSSSTYSNPRPAAHPTSRAQATSCSAPSPTRPISAARSAMTRSWTRSRGRVCWCCVSEG